MTEGKKLKQKEYQARYDEKTQTVQAKYVLKDMDEYYELKKYLERTGQTANGFIKALICDFLKNGDTNSKYPPAKENEKIVLDKYYGMGEIFERLKLILDCDMEKYNAVLDIFAQSLKSNLELALEEYTGNFENWVDEELEDAISDGTINMSSIETFKKDVEHCMKIGDIYVS